MVKFSVVNTGCYGSQMTAVNQKTHLWKTDDDVTFFPLVTQSLTMEIGFLQFASQFKRTSEIRRY